MPAIRLPQSLQEINAAAQQIVRAAYPDLQASGSPQLIKEFELDRKIVAGWLATIAPLGALAHTDVVTQSALCISRCSSQMHALTPGRVATIINRRHWVRAA